MPGQERSRRLTVEERTLAQAIVPQWVMAAPRAAAKSYVVNLNTICGWVPPRSAASLLFDVAPVELPVEVDASCANFSLAQLSIPRGVQVLAIWRAEKSSSGAGAPAGAPERRRSIGGGEGSTGKTPPKTAKVGFGDSLLLRGTAHQLAQVCISKQGKVYLAAPKIAKEELLPKLKAEKQALLAAAEDLQSRLLPHARRRIAESRFDARRLWAVSVIQAKRRGQVCRAFMGVAIAQRRRRVLAGRLAARKQVAMMLKSSLEAPLVTVVKNPTRADTAPRVKSKEDLIAMIMHARDRDLARRYSATINKLIAAAPEGKSDAAASGGPLLHPPLSPLRLLFYGPIELTATVDSACGSKKISELQLPAGVSVSRMRQRGVAVQVRPATIMSTAVQIDDRVTFKGEPHALAGLLDVKAKKLVVLPPKGRGDPTQLSRERQALMVSAERLATWTQWLLRRRLELRNYHRLSHAALMIQIAWVLSMVRRDTKMQQESGAGKSSFTVSYIRKPEPGAAKRMLADVASTDIDASADGKADRASTASPEPEAERVVIKTSKGWAELRKKRSILRGAIVVNKELRRIRQKKKPSQVRAAKAAAAGQGGTLKRSATASSVVHHSSGTGHAAAPKGRAPTAPNGRNGNGNGSGPPPRRGSASGAAGRKPEPKSACF